MTVEELAAEDPADQEEDLGTAQSVTISDESPVTTPVTETAFSMLASITEESVVVQPPYQRRAFWDRRKKASLIESVFLGLPLPLIYLADANTVIDGEKVRIREVVDGQQRLSSLREFYNNQLEIPDDSIVEDLRGKTFGQLRPSLKQTFKDFKLSTATIPLNARADKFELFKRLNQQSTVLSDQELRNAAYHGAYLQELKERAGQLRDSLRVTDAEYKRMKDVEYLTRLLAFERAGYDAFPNKKLNKFLNTEMELGGAETPSEWEKRVKRVRRALDRVEKLFGEMRFRPYRIPETGYNGEWARTVNRALMEVQVWSFLDHSRYGFADAGSFDSALIDKKQAVLDAVTRLHAYNERFNDSIQRGTTGSPNVSYRFSRYVAAVAWALEEIGDGRRRRFFTPQQKQNVWDKLPVDERECAECGHELVFAETEVDHIVPWANGGETVEKNAQLLHIACNRAKGARWDPVVESADTTP
ncbi:HNH endonuclease family protein [Agromyces sp. NPDC056523]|uniref:HNH endonuclease family protein n=1 Tax=Agromyces sp. NPDC056523 TaxID=3345850 RepID=UPI00366C192A